VRVQCKGCRIEFKIPEEKMPEGIKLTIRCPNCKTPNEISREITAVGPDHPNKKDSRSVEPEFDPALNYASEIDIVDEGVRTALLCTTGASADKIAQALRELDFWVFHAPHPDLALTKLHHNHYDLIVLDEDYSSEGESANPVLHHVQLLPMHQRRQFFLCLLSRQEPTLDTKSAFRIGVNLILNFRDIEKTKIMIAREMKEYRNFYSLYNAELAKK